MTGVGPQPGATWHKDSGGPAVSGNSQRRAGHSFGAAGGSRTRRCPRRPRPSDRAILVPTTQRYRERPRARSETSRSATTRGWWGPRLGGAVRYPPCVRSRAAPLLSAKPQRRSAARRHPSPNDRCPPTQRPRAALRWRSLDGRRPRGPVAPRHRAGAPARRNRRRMVGHPGAARAKVATVSRNAEATNKRTSKIEPVRPPPSPAPPTAQIERARLPHTRTRFANAPSNTGPSGCFLRRDRAHAAAPPRSAPTGRRSDQGRTPSPAWRWPPTQHAGSCPFCSVRRPQKRDTTER